MDAKVVFPEKDFRDVFQYFTENNELESNCFAFARKEIFVNEIEYRVISNLKYFPVESDYEERKINSLVLREGFISDLYALAKQVGCHAIIDMHNHPGTDKWIEPGESRSDQDVIHFEWKEAKRFFRKRFTPDLVFLIFNRDIRRFAGKALSEGFRKDHKVKYIEVREEMNLDKAVSFKSVDIGIDKWRQPNPLSFFQDYPQAPGNNDISPEQVRQIFNNLSESDKKNFIQQFLFKDCKVDFNFGK